MRVTGLTAEKMQEILDGLPSGAHITGDDLILELAGGGIIDVGSVRGVQGIKGDTGGDISGVKQLLSPTGIIAPYAGGVAPAGWLLCDGTSYLRTTYSDLFTVIGTTYGSIDSTHFNVPDLQGRFPIGRAGSGATGDPLLNVGGHGGSRDAVVVAHAHPHDHTIGADGKHSHSIAGDAGDRIYVSKAQPAPFAVQYTSTAPYGTAALSHLDQSVTHAHGGKTGSDSSSVGVSATDANLPPYLVVKYIIRYGL